MNEILEFVKELHKLGVGTQEKIVSKNPHVNGDCDKTWGKEYQNCNLKLQ